MNLIVDEYGILKTSPEASAIVASIVNNRGRILVSWTDGEGSQLDILFALLFRDGIEEMLAKPQSGIKPDYLFVSIMRVGAFAFDINNEFTHPNTYIEKLTLPAIMHGSTANKLADLINGVKIALKSLR